MTTQRIGFLIWPSTRPLTLALAEEVLQVAQRVHPEVVYDLVFLQAEPAQEGSWRLPGEPWNGRLEGVTSCSCWLTSSRRRWGLRCLRRSSSWRAVAA